MRKVLKWIGIILGSLIGLIALVVAALLIYGQVSFKPTNADRPLYPIEADTSPEGVERGKYLMEAVMGCAGACHTPMENGAPLSGTSENINEGPISVVFSAPNLTPDAETGLGSWTDAEIARAIREGVDKDGVSLVVMPSYNYHFLSDADVASIVAYLRNLEPVHNAVPPFEANAVARVMVAVGMFGPSPMGEPITAPQNAPEPGNAEYGGYLVALGACTDCHGSNLAGGAIPFAEPGTPDAANLTPAGDLGSWNEADFLTAMRNGMTPDGEILDPESMPWPEYANMTDEDIYAIFQYLQTLPAVSSAP